jgi:hypothetical protein
MYFGFTIFMCLDPIRWDQSRPTESNNETGSEQVEGSRDYVSHGTSLNIRYV